MLATRQFHASSGKRPWTFYALASLFGAYLLFLYGPMLVMYLLSFQGPNGGVTFPMVGVSTVWFEDIMRPGQMANIPVAFQRSIALASIVSLVTMVVPVAAGLGFRRRFPGSGVLFYLAVASLVMPILLPGIIGVGMGAFTLSYDEYARTTLAIGSRNTLPLEIYALISSATSPTLFAIGTVTTTVSFCAIGLTLWVVFHIQRRRTRA